MAAAYRYAVQRGPVPGELSLYRAISQFGVEAVCGRKVLSGFEIRAMQTAKAMDDALEMWLNAENRAEWENDNPDLATRIHEAAEIVENGRC